MDFEALISVCLGIGLAAACGFRVFVPLLGVSLAAASGHMQLAEGWQWVGSTPALVCLATATVLEIGAYYVPWLDNLLDTAATPAAVIAGTICTASVVTDMSPLMRWSLALIAGGGIAAAVQSATVLVRGASTATTGGLANFLVSSGELGLSVATTAAAFAVPVLCALAVLGGGVFFALRFLGGRQVAQPPVV